jgi:hypothetical protein
MNNTFKKILKGGAFVASSALSFIAGYFYCKKKLYMELNKQLEEAMIDIKKSCEKQTTKPKATSDTSLEKNVSQRSDPKDFSESDKTKYYNYANQYKSLNKSPDDPELSNAETCEPDVIITERFESTDLNEFKTNANNYMKSRVLLFRDLEFAYADNYELIDSPEEVLGREAEEYFYQADDLDDSTPNFYVKDNTKQIIYEIQYDDRSSGDAIYEYNNLK